ncbi:hypothetical protein [Pseudoalteromonas piscicida]|uniref:hypothetical protein n=1 Tax=Pseudoalteromonas piscicida TaxID=43662 RepID=UPI001C96115B|nr:hypothetical protein [Pseudoalteromonas piscicida]QZO15018.1 hypothetical protein K5642_22370 [Pseudoalteromonas piscicida]
MAHENITQYKLAWDVDSNKGYISLYTAQSGEVQPMVFTNPSSFNAVALILQNEKPVFYDTTKLIVYSGAEPVGIIEQ